MKVSAKKSSNSGSIELKALPLSERLRQGINALFKRVA
jgi:hypothetical protein